MPRARQQIWNFASTLSLSLRAYAKETAMGSATDKIKAQGERSHRRSQAKFRAKRRARKIKRRRRRSGGQGSRSAGGRQCEGRSKGCNQLSCRACEQEPLIFHSDSRRKKTGLGPVFPFHRARKVCVSSRLCSSVRLPAAPIPFLPMKLRISLRTDRRMDHDFTQIALGHDIPWR